MALYFNILESPLPKRALCQVWLKLDQWCLRRFLNFINVFSPFRNYLPLEIGVVLYFDELESPSHEMLCAKFGWNWPSGF